MLEIFRENFIAGLSIVSPVVNDKGFLPITGHVLVQVQGDKMYLTGTNLDSVANVWVGVKSQSDFSCCLPLKKLLNVLNARNEDVVTFSYDEQKVEALLKAGRSRSKIKAIAADEFPNVQTLPQMKQNVDVSFTITAGEFVQVLNTVKGNASTDGLRQALNSLHTKLEDDQLFVEATDGFRLCWCTVGVTSQQDGEFLPSIGGINALVRFIKSISPDEDKDLNVFASDTRFCVSADGFYFVGSMVNATYPDASIYRDMVDSQTKIIELDKELFKSTIKAAQAYRSEVLLEFKDNKVAISAQSQELGDYHDELDFIGDGEATVMLNISHLNEVLARLEEDKIGIKLMGDDQQVFIIENDYRWLLMPFGRK